MGIRHDENEERRALWTPDDEAVRRVLHRRAALLAERLAGDSDMDEEAAARGVDCLVLRLAGERMAIDADLVANVLRAPHLCPIPCTPPWVLGVANMRGRVLSVLDIGLYWGLRREPGDSGAVVALSMPGRRGAPGMELGLAVDEVEGVRRMPEELREPGLLASRLADVVRGVAPGPVLVLDGVSLLSDKSLIIQEEVGGDSRR